MVDKADAPMVVVIDDDQAVREALGGLFASVGLAVDLFASIDAYLEKDPGQRIECLVLDVRLPGKSGLEFIEEQARAGIRRAIVFISGHADVAMSVRAMKAGAVEFLTKPVREQDLLDAVQHALAHARKHRAQEERLAEVRSRYAFLTARERAVMAQVVSGRLSKQIAEGMGVTEATIKLHRGQIMRKMQASSVIELVRISDILGA
jgi:FixJ family two-component response regulator